MSDDGETSPGWKIAAAIGVVGGLILVGSLRAKSANARLEELEREGAERFGASDVDGDGEEDFDPLPFVRHKMRMLIHEGYSPEQAYAIANRIAGVST